MPDSELIGQTVARYTILEKLGEGGMGVVYRARDARLDRFVAFKVLRPEAVHDADRRRRFIQEARTASALNHPNIVTIYDIDSADGLSYIAMEHVVGVPLNQLIARGLRLTEVLKYGIQISDALAAAHAAGIIHRDLKPGNVLVTDRGLVKLLDFGLAKLVEGGMANLDTKTLQLAPATVEGVIVGTVAYMSPEQAEGLPIDHRSDIFSFGTVLYEMATGRRPFTGQTTISTLSAILSREVPPISDTSERVQLDLDRIIHRCLRKDRERRSQHMVDVKLALEELLEDLKSSVDEPNRGPATQTLSSNVSVQATAKPADARITPRISWSALAPWAILVIVAAGSILWAMTRNVAPRLPPILTRLTADAGLSAYPALSQDGALLAFASDRGGDGSLDIWVQQTGQSQPLRLTNDPGDDYDPAFSPDGTRIAFRSDRGGGGIYVVPALGGPARLIAKGGRRPRFSQDGKSIAFWAGGMGNSFLPGSTSVYVVNADGGEAQRVHSEFAAIRHPAWMPDGRLLFVGRWEADVDWWIAPVDGGPVIKTGALPTLQERRLRPPSGDYTINPNQVLPDGRGVLFSAALGDSTNIWQLDLSSRGEVVGRPRQITFGTSIEGQATAGRREPLAVAFTSLTVNLDIWSTPIDQARGRITGPDERLTDAVSFEGYPDVSRDGRRLAYVASRPGGWDVRLRDMETKAETTLASGPSPLMQTRINSTGSHVAYWQRDQGIRAVYVASSSAGVTRKLCDECGPATDVSPDGSLVLLESVGPPEGIVLANTVSKKQLLVVVSKAHPEALLYNARFSPDARWIAFHAAMGSSTARQIFVVPFRGEHGASTPGGITDADWVPITDGSQMDREPYWSSDSNALYFLSERDGFRCMWMQHLEPTTRHPLGAAIPVRHFHSARRSLSTGDVRSSAVELSLSANRMFFGIPELTGNIWLATEQSGQPKD
jgi:eukaryotic-like serine/threonine-protein kinase